MRTLFTTAFLCLSAGLSYSQIVIIDKVEVLNQNFEEAIFYYQNNWEEARKIALRKGYISDYSLLINTDSSSKEQIYLITKLENETAYQELESNFEKVFKSMNRDKPKLLNEKTPAAFRKVTNVVLKGL